MTGRPAETKATTADTTIQSDYRTILRWSAPTGLWEALGDAPTDDAAWQLLLAALKRAGPIDWTLHQRPAAAGRAAWDETSEEVKARFDAEVAGIITSSRAAGRGKARK